MPSTNPTVVPMVPLSTSSTSRIEILQGEASAPKKQRLSSPYFDTMSESEQVNADRHLARAIYSSGCPL